MGTRVSSRGCRGLYLYSPIYLQDVDKETLAFFFLMPQGLQSFQCTFPVSRLGYKALNRYLLITFLSNLNPACSKHTTTTWQANILLQILCNRDMNKNSTQNAFDVVHRRKSMLCAFAIHFVHRRALRLTPNYCGRERCKDRAARKLERTQAARDDQCSASKTPTQAEPPAATRRI